MQKRLIKISIIIFLIFVVCSFAHQTMACAVRPSVESLFKKSDIVFEGDVTQDGKWYELGKNNPHEVVFQVRKIWKGPKVPSVTMLAPPLQVGVSYLIFAKEGRLTEEGCPGSIQKIQSKEMELKELNSAVSRLGIVYDDSHSTVQADLKKLGKPIYEFEPK